MKIISAKKLSEALSKAQGVGLVEESFTICNCEIVLRNLIPDQYEAIVNETKELEDMAFMHAYQRAHVARSIVEINGMDLRDVKFVEVEEEDPKKPDHVRTIKIELHNWINKYVLGSWSKEAILVAFRKVGDVVSQAEEKAKEGIQFLTPEETPEEKFRRIVGELREAEEDLPVEVVSHIMHEAGYLRKSTSEEVAAVDERLSRLAAEQAQQVEEAPVEPPPPPEPVQPSAPTPQELMARRAPLNRIPVQTPPVPRAEPQELTRVAPVAPPVPPTTPAARSSKIAALEGEALDDEAIAMAGPPGLRHQEVAELSHKAEPMNPKAFGSIVEQPPVGGVNPRYRPPQR